MMKRLLSLFMLGLLLACSHEWRTEAPVQPSTYAAPSYRAASSIGRLGRLAVLAVDIHLDAESGEQEQPAWLARRDSLARELQVSVGDYLATKKGYDIRLVDEPSPPSGEEAMRVVGKRLNVDGIVVVERWYKRPWSTTKAIMNVFLLNVPLFRALSALNLRVSIYETASGRLVWQRELKGEIDDRREKIDLANVFGDLENAVPVQLRR